MKVGIVGLGVVGSTLDYGFTRLGHEVLRHDVKRSTHLAYVLGAELVFVCVPTPMAVSGACDTSEVEKVVGGLNELDYKGLVVIKSTVVPGTTDSLHKRYPKLRLAFCPEFLREKSTYSDFVENHDVLVVGVTYSDTTAADLALVRAVHGYYPKRHYACDAIDAELIKYFSNAFNAMRVVFANQFYDMCETLGANYQAVKDGAALRPSIGNYYLDCNDNFRSFGGSCLPKDVSALAALCRQRGIGVDMFDWILDQNEQVKLIQEVTRRSVG